MLPRRVSQSDAVAVAPTTIEMSTHSIDAIVDKMANSAIHDTVHSGAGISYAASNQTQQKVMKFGIGHRDDKMEVSSDEIFECPVVPMTRSNFECLPSNILLDIFKRSDDTGLMHLAEMSQRFADVAKIFVINSEEMGGDSDACLAKWSEIGSQKQAIYINHIDGINPEQWALKMLQPHIEHIKKLTFDSCSFQTSDRIQLSGAIEELSAKIFDDPTSLAKITHLTIRHSFCDCNKQEDGEQEPMIDLSGCRNLKKLELHGMDGQRFWWHRLQQVIQNNPAIHSLLLHDLVIPHTGLWKILPEVAAHLSHITELALMMDSVFSEDMTQVDDAVFMALRHLESLSLSVDPKLMGFLRLFGLQCRQIKHLGLRVHGASAYARAEWRNVLAQLAQSFQQIESFHFYSYESIKCDIEPFVEHLPNLRHLSIEPSYQNDIECTDALSLLYVCPSLQKITIVFKYSCDGYPETFVSAQFFEDFINATTITAKPNACIEIEERNRTIGSVTANGIVWRKKLMYWMDVKRCGSDGMQLLDLIEHMQNGTDRFNLLDRIFDYLDVSSLYSFAETNEDSKQLVMDYVEKHSKNGGWFTITDEIQPFEYVDFWAVFNELGLIEHAIGLNVRTIRRETKNEIIDAVQSLQCLVQLSIYDEHPQERWPCVTMNISHVVYDASHCLGFDELHDVVEKFPDAKTIEFKKAGLFKDNKPNVHQALYQDEWPKFYDSKKFAFNYRGETQLKNLKKIFEGVNIELVPIFPKKD